MIKLIVFDLDGTLLNTLADLTESVNYAMRTLGLKQHTEEEIAGFLGNGAEILCKRAVGEHTELWQECFALHGKYYAAHSVEYTAPYDGIEEMLAEIRSMGVKIGVFSNKDDAVVKSLCDGMLHGKIDFACGTLPLGKKKPDPFGVLEIMRRCNVEKNQTVFCGDSETDIQTAANADVQCVSVTWGFRSERILKRNGATLLANKPSDVVEILKNINKY